MDGNTIPVSENTTIIVKASGDLFLQGQDQGEVHFQSGEDRIRVNQSSDTLYVETHANLDLNIPRHANVVIEKVGGSALVEDLTNSLVVQKVGGDLALQRLGKVQIDKVGGNCLIEGVSGDLILGKVGGDLTARQVVGRMEAGNIGGNGDLQVMGNGSLEVRSGGDLRVYITESVIDHTMLRAGGDVTIYLPSNVNSRFSLFANSETIDINLSRQGQPSNQNIESRHYEFTLGDDGAMIEAQSGGDMMVSDEAVEPESITGELDRRESAWIEARERRGSPSWSAGFGFDRSSAWADMVSRRAQEAARRAEQRAQTATRRTEDQIRQAAERQVHQAFGHHFDFTPPQPPFPPQPAADPVSDQERLMVLQMLRDGKITVEQAEKLLAALEGRNR